MPGNFADNTSRSKMAELLARPASKSGVSTLISPSSASAMRLTTSMTFALTAGTSTPVLKSS
eukprot:11955135-Alexandrium_andersonii.AAC.1